MTKQFEMWGRIPYLDEVTPEWEYLGLWEDFWGLPWRIFRHKKTKEVRYTKF